MIVELLSQKIVEFPQPYDWQAQIVAATNPTLVLDKVTMDCSLENNE